MTQIGQLRSFKTYGESKAMLDPLPSVKTYNEHAKESATRPGGKERGYGNDWKIARKDYLRHNRLCTMCGRLAAVVDHIRPMRYGGKRFEENNLQSLCRKCHASKTTTDDAVAKASGWGAPLWGKGAKSSSDTPGKPPRAPSHKN